MYGPLRLLYDLPSRRKKKRPKKLKLKVKRSHSDDWTYIDVDQEKYPFLILFPYFSMPKIHQTNPTLNGAKTKRLWIRGASPSYNFELLLAQLTNELKVYSIMPEAKTHVEEFCQMLAKIGYSFAVGELGFGSFTPFLIPHIINKEMNDSDKYIGSLDEDEKATENLHEISIINTNQNDFVTVRIRLLAKLGTPTYYVVVGIFNKG
jgi:hypothetical protein